MAIKYEIKKENLSKIPKSFLHDLFFQNQNKYEDICVFNYKNISISLNREESSVSVSKNYPNYYNFNVTLHNSNTSENILANFKIVEFQGRAIQGFLSIYYEPYNWIYFTLKIFENNLYYFLNYYKKVLEKNNDGVY